jgi:hypothetical protein
MSSDASQEGASGDEQAGGSRHTNQNNSVNDAGADSGSVADAELATPAERVEEFKRKYPERADLRLTSRHGQRIRRDYTHERYESWTAETADPMEPNITGEELVERKAYTWLEAVAECLEGHADTRRTTINLEYGYPSDPEHAEFSIDAETRWFASYQRRYFAQMKAWLRELCGGERPSGGYTTADFDDPHLALITLSASSVPDGQRVGPIDHVEQRRSSWRACYDTLRNTMRSLGFELGTDWQYDRRSEPHTGDRGGGLNHCYGHDHIVVAVDGEVSAADFRPVVEKHVEECDSAGASAHDLDEVWRDPNAIDTVEVKPANELENLANYVASYCGIEPVDLLERSIEYVAWAAATTAANKKTVSRSDAAKHAAAADACKQRAASPCSDQDREHGERILSSTKRGIEVECLECGSPHGIDQGRDPITAASTGQPELVADGGVVDDRLDDLQASYSSARAAASVGESCEQTRRRARLEEFLNENPAVPVSVALGTLDLPPTASSLFHEIRADIDTSELVGFERGPEWHVKSVTVGNEEYPASAGNGVEIVESVLPAEKLYQESRLSDSPGVASWRCDRTNVHVYGGRSMARYLVSEGITHSEVVDQVVTPERVSYPESP